jgi:hypothetical protein
LESRDDLDTFEKTRILISERNSSHDSTVFQPLA